jgi:hypothetical protein
MWGDLDGLLPATAGRVLQFGISAFREIFPTGLFQLKWQKNPQFFWSESL